MSHPSQLVRPRAAPRGIIGAVIRTTIFVGGVFSAVLVLTIAAATQDRFPDAPGKPVLLKVCSSCHEAEKVLAQSLTADGWAENLLNMAQFGADATDEEWRVIQQYLDSQLATIVINKATADEIRRTVDVSEAVAQAVVTYRREHGDFKSVDDLKKVPGLEAAKVEARKDRLIF
jgi:competence protein ComEA